MTFLSHALDTLSALCPWSQLLGSGHLCTAREAQGQVAGLRGQTPAPQSLAVFPYEWAVGWGLFLISFVSARAPASQCECPGVSELSSQPVLGGAGSIPGSPQVLTQVAKPVSVGEHTAMSYDLGQGDFDPHSLQDLE